jgi:hypothetical protein
MLLRIDGRMDTSLMVGDFRAWLGKELVATILAARKNYARQLGQTTRWLSIESGSMTASPYRYSQNRNATSVSADPQNSPMTFALLYLYVVPPHSMARRNMIPRRGKDCEAEDVEGAEDRRKPVLISLWMKQRTRVTSPPTSKST